MLTAQALLEIGAIYVGIITAGWTIQQLYQKQLDHKRKMQQDKDGRAIEIKDLENRMTNFERDLRDVRDLSNRYLDTLQQMANRNSNRL